jgi:hypothetical protein
MSKTDLMRFEEKLDKVVKYYLSDPQSSRLSDSLKEQLQRWKFIRMVFSSWQISNPRQVVNAVMKEFGIEERQAYRDVQCAQKLYVRLEETNKEFERILLIESIKKNKAKAEAQGNYKVVAMYDANLIKIGGYDKELEQPKIIQIIKNEMVYDPRLVGGEEIEDLEKITRQFMAKKKKQIDDEFAVDANIIEEELNYASSK